MSLEKFRKEIDFIDSKIIKLLEKRLKVVSKIKPFKKKLTDKKREREILEKITSPYIQNIYKSIFKASKQIFKK
jgi:chorismate mutase